MPGNRLTRLVSLILLPGFYANVTKRMATGRFIDGNRVRFHKGMPEKIGGWERIELTAFDQDVSYIVLSGSNSGSENDLSWVASTGEFPIAGYRLYNADNDSLIVDTALTTYAHTGLSTGTYNYYAVSYDTEGTVSPRSNIVSLDVAAPAGFFLASTAGSILKSTDGLTFTAVVTGLSNTMRGLAYAPSIPLIVAVGSSTPYVYTSPDGTTWTQRTPSSNRIWECVEWSPEIGIFVAGSSNTTTAGNMMSSPDGVTWTARNGVSQFHNDITHSATLTAFVAACQPGLNSAGTTADRSLNGTTWASAGTVASASWKSICRSEVLGIFVAVGTGGAESPTSVLATSTFGTTGTWTSRTGISGSWYGVTRSETLGLFCAVGSNGTISPDDGAIMTSTDGVTWTERTPPVTGDIIVWKAVCWSDPLSMFVAIGASANTNTGVKMRSTDGINWTGFGEIAPSPDNGNGYDIIWIPG